MQYGNLFQCNGIDGVDIFLACSETGLATSLIFFAMFKFTLTRFDNSRDPKLWIPYVNSNKPKEN